MTTKSTSLFFVLLLLLATTNCSRIADTTYPTYTIGPFEKKLRPPFGGDFLWLQPIQDNSFLKNIPDIPTDTAIVIAFSLLHHRIGIGEDISNQMHLFIGINESKQEKYVVVDANNNLDFSDDPVFVFSLLDATLTRDEKRERAVALWVTPNPNKNDSVRIGIDPFNTLFGFTFPFDERLKTTLTLPDDWEAPPTKVGNAPVRGIFAHPFPNLLQRNLDEKTSFRITFDDEADMPVSRSFRYGDTIRIRDGLYKLSKIEHPYIELNRIGFLADSSRVGSFVPIVYARCIEQSNLVSINNLIRDKYVFINLWGSWCGPCIRAIPELKQLYNKIKDRTDVLLLGVASERSEDLKILKEIIDSREIEWLNLWLSSADDRLATSIFRQLQVRSFPTYFVLDNTGKIVYRGNGTQEAIGFFLELIE